MWWPVITLHAFTQNSCQPLISNFLWHRLNSHHHLLLLRSLLLLHLPKAASVEPLKTSKDEGGVISAAHLLVNWLKWSWHTSLHWLRGTTLFVMVNIEEQLLCWQTSRLLEGALELYELVLTVGWGRVEDKDDAVGAFLNRSPAFLIAPITWNIPELNVDFAENAGRCRSVLLVLNDSINLLHLFSFFVRSLCCFKTYLTPTVGL